MNLFILRVVYEDRILGGHAVGSTPRTTTWEKEGVRLTPDYLTK